MRKESIDLMVERVQLSDFPDFVFLKIARRHRDNAPLAVLGAVTRHNNGFGHIVELVGGDVGNEVAALQPTVRGARAV